MSEAVLSSGSKEPRPAMIPMMSELRKQYDQRIMMSEGYWVHFPHFTPHFAGDFGLKESWAFVPGDDKDPNGWSHCLRGVFTVLMIIRTDSAWEAFSLGWVLVAHYPLNTPTDELLRRALVEYRLGKQ